MVLFKRKPVQYLPRPAIEDDSSEVWVIPETNEVFTNYEPYLQRMDFYKQRRFICEITGHSGLTFFEALRSEMEESREVNNIFPDALKEPILRRIQFSTVSRVDNLVDEIYEEFKRDFYPGEPVLILLDDNTRLHGIIRDKANFAEQLHPDGTVKTPAYAMYLVKVLDRPNEEALLDHEHITRDRKTFTKQMLRAFIKNNVNRESWNGAPWLVKPSIAEEYRIPTEVPKHLQYGAKVAEKKAMKKADQDGFFGFFASQQLPELKPAAAKGSKSKPSNQDLSRSKEAQFLEYQRSLNGNPGFVVNNNNNKTNGAARPPKGQEADKKSPAVPAVVVKTEEPKPSPPPIKYPIEDLDIAPEREKKRQRPLLNLLTMDETEDSDDEDILHDELEMKSVGGLLETWNTLNVYCEVFELDSFTFDDFLQAMRFSSADADCELFVEVHCAVLKKLVNAADDDNGAVQISLPDLPEEESDDAEEEEEDEEEEEAEPTPEPEPTRMTTRSSLAKAEAENIKARGDRSRSSTEEIQIHRAAEMFGDYGWIDRLRKRDFRHGGWELIMVGLLYRLSQRPRMEKACNEILQHLAPLDAEPTQETAQVQYSTLNVNLRIQALQIICMLCLETKAIRNYLEECGNQMTEFRKEKIEHQKARKAGLEELRRLHQERKALQPEPEKSPTPAPELDALEDSKMTGIDTEQDSDEEDAPKRSLRGGMDRMLERKRKQDEERERKEQLAKQPKGTKQYQRVLKKIDEQKAAIEKLEEKIEVLDNDLREADCPRTRCLGKDRFCNRYWWFERNAMPYAGMPNSSTAEARYANGRLWVQGPDEMERVGFIDVSDEQKKEYQKEFHVTPAERKMAEEGPTQLSNADEWGYYESPDAIERLIDWLDSRGLRECKLQKELQLHRNNIAKYMNVRREYLAETAERAESEDVPTKRVSTRNKTYVDDGKHRCLRWHNTTALSENGHLHVDAGRPAKRTKRATDEPKDLKATNRQGKVLTRQGGRYNF